jgi:hypothetical protein
MKAYILSDADFEMLLSAIDRDPRWGTQGGSGQVMNEEERRVHEDAHRFFNYQIRIWLNKVKT